MHFFCFICAQFLLLFLLHLHNNLNVSWCYGGNLRYIFHSAQLFIPLRTWFVVVISGIIVSEMLKCHEKWIAVGLSFDNLFYFLVCKRLRLMKKTIAEAMRFTSFLIQRTLLHRSKAIFQVFFFSFSRYSATIRPLFITFPQHHKGQQRTVHKSIVLSGGE